MKHFERVTQTVTGDKYIKTTCDICGEDVEEEDMYETREIEIRHRKGESYPEGAWGKELKVDLCESCWCKRLLPWLREQGVTREYERYDF